MTKNDKKNFIKIEAVVFLLSTALSTFYAARVDNGSWTNPNPFAGPGHYMSMAESLLFNIPLGISDGIIAALLIAPSVILCLKITGDRKRQSCRPVR